MKLKTIIKILQIFTLLLLGCKESVNNSNSGELETLSTDTLEVNVTNGIKMTLTGLKDNYSINDILKGVITLNNFNDTNHFHVNFPFFPGYSFSVYDKEMTFSGGGPDVLGSPGIDYVLLKGKKYNYNVYWSLKTVAHVGGYIELPAIAGEYYLKFTLEGNPDFWDKYLIKKITIDESGDQTPVTFVNTYDQFDFAILQLVIRNRFSREAVYHYKDSSYADLSIIKYPDGKETLYKEKYYFPNKTLILKGKSDSLLFWYHFDKKRPALSNLDGTYKIIMKMSFMEKEYADSSTIDFLKSGN